MPELPEVETTLRGIAPHLQGALVQDVIVRNAQLRWPIPAALPSLLRGRAILGLQRRAKYLLIAFEHGTLILHLGMSGSLRILPHGTPPERHDHFDLVLDNGKLMRLRDPRRFGAVLWHKGDILEHPLLVTLGPEPLGEAFDADYLYRATRSRSAAIKLALMDNHLVVGVGNIYANEALFRAGIRPQLPAKRLSRARCAILVQTVQEVLRAAIDKGGSSLRDFIHSDGSSGYFQQHYFVYGRGGEVCHRCRTPVRVIRQGQRSTFYCPHCQH
ncbi:bifunctional DNA-formamidopyrimidine glycosylase/DNA-(apurinic or apyrimidinic site) lyase [Sideroxyarcus sp. TK5]